MKKICSPNIRYPCLAAILASYFEARTAEQLAIPNLKQLNSLVPPTLDLVASCYVARSPDQTYVFLLQHSAESKLCKSYHSLYICKSIFLNYLKINLLKHVVWKTFHASNPNEYAPMLLPIRCFDFPKIYTMSRIIRVMIQKYSYQNINREGG